MKTRKSIVLTELALFCYFFIVHVLLGKPPKHLNTYSPPPPPGVVQTTPLEYRPVSFPRGWGSALGNSSPIVVITAGIPGTGMNEAAQIVPGAGRQAPSQNIPGTEASSSAGLNAVNPTPAPDVHEDEARYTESLPAGIQPFKDVVETAKSVDVVALQQVVLHQELAVKTKQPRYTINIRGQALLDAFRSLTTERQKEFVEKVAYAFSLQKRIVENQYPVFARTHRNFVALTLTENQCELELSELRQDPKTNARKIKHFEKKILRLGHRAELTYDQLNTQGTKIKQAEEKLKKRTDYLFAAFRVPTSLAPSPCSSPPSSSLPAPTLSPVNTTSAEVLIMKDLYKVPRKSRSDTLKKIYLSRGPFLTIYKNNLETAKKVFLAGLKAQNRSVRSMTVQERKQYRTWKQLTADEKLEVDGLWFKSLTLAEQRSFTSEVRISESGHKARAEKLTERIFDVPQSELPNLTSGVDLLNQINNPGVLDQVINMYSLEIDNANVETTVKIQRWAGSQHQNKDSKISKAVRDEALVEENAYRTPNKYGVTPADIEAEKLFAELDEAQINILREITKDLKFLVNNPNTDLGQAVQDSRRSKWGVTFNQSSNKKYLSDVMFVLVRTSDRFRASHGISFRSDYATKSMAISQRDALKLGIPIGTGLLECHHYILNSLGGAHALYNLCFLTPSKHALLHWSLELERYSLGKAGTSANIPAAASRVGSLVTDLASPPTPAS